MPRWSREDITKVVLRIKDEFEAKRPAMEKEMERQLAESRRAWTHPNEDEDTDYEDTDYDVRTGVDVLRCADCGERGERTGHMICQYPQDHA